MALTVANLGCEGLYPQGQGGEIADPLPRRELAEREELIRTVPQRTPVEPLSRQVAEKAVNGSLQPGAADTRPCPRAGKEIVQQSEPTSNRASQRAGCASNATQACPTKDGRADPSISLCAVQEEDLLMRNASLRSTPDNIELRITQVMSRAT